MNLEQKVDLIEGELGLMKGEIKQTLVDLREFIMKQGSPFAGGGPARATAASRGGDLDALGLMDTDLSQQIGGAPTEPGLAPGEIERMLDEARASGREEANVGLPGNEPAEPAISRDDIEQMLAEARASAREDAAASVREEMEEMRRANQRELESLRLQQTSQANVAPQAGPQEFGTPANAPPAIQASQPAPVQTTIPQVGQTGIEVPRVEQRASEEAAPQPASQPTQVIRIQQPRTRDLEEQVQVRDEGIPVTIAPPAEAAADAAGEVETPGPESVTPPQAPAAPEELPSTTALDSNLVTNLMRWVGSVKRRLGKTQLEGFLEIYKLTGHLPPVVERLIFHLADLGALPDDSKDQVFTLDDLMDSLLQLHAIVYGPGYAARGVLLDPDEEDEPPEDAHPPEEDAVEDG